MSKELRDESTEGAKEIWEAVDRAANNAPEWLKEMFNKAKGKYISWVYRLKLRISCYNLKKSFNRFSKATNKTTKTIMKFRESYDKAICDQLDG